MAYTRDTSFSARLVKALADAERVFIRNVQIEFAL